LPHEHYNVKQKFCQVRASPAAPGQSGTALIIPNEREARIVIAGRRAYGKACAVIPKIHIRKLNRDEYVNLSTGEVLPFQKNETKQPKNVRKTMQELRQLIAANFYDDGTNSKVITDKNGKDKLILTNSVFLTLTYKENMQEPGRLFRDFRVFMKRIRYHYKQHEIAYIAVAEPQGRGAWHLHVMLKSLNQESFWLTHNVLWLNWVDVIGGEGAAHVEPMLASSPADYFSAYFTDITDETQDREGRAKARQKGARLDMYPPGMRFYRCSRNIARPDRARMTLHDAQEALGEPMYTSTTNIIGTEPNGKESVLNTIQNMTWEVKENAYADGER